jgi:tRNA (guanine-N7-)-methyltransferase
MGKKKLIRFEENKGNPNLFEPDAKELLAAPHHLKGRWGEVYFKNSNKIIVELGCGKGEYTTELARLFPENNYIGMDIKGSRIYHGAKFCHESRQENACFVRAQVDLIDRIFGKEISEAWITFPDPSIEKARRRLVHPKFLELYRKVALPGAKFYLKTDSRELYEYALEVIPQNKGQIVYNTDDYYSSEVTATLPDIKTTYEKRYLAQGKTICLVIFKLN